jgi:hypothetical protein
MLSTFTSVVRNFRVSLPNNYDPDQIAAYFDHRPHVLIFQLLEVLLLLWHLPIAVALSYPIFLEILPK